MKKIIVIFRMFLFMFIERIRLIKHKSIKKTNPKHYEDLIFNVVKQWSQYVIKIAGTRVETIGLENIPEGNCLFVGNHQSNLDIPIVLSQLNKNVSFISKKELGKIPLFSFWMKKMHCVFLDRNNVRDAVNSISEGANILKNHCSMVIFPEGTRSKSSKMGSFRKGSIKFGLKAEVPIVPFTIIDSYKGYEEKGTFSECNVKLIINKPIYVSSLSKEEKVHIIEKIKGIIDSNLQT